jgi:hypothetical protein
MKSYIKVFTLSIVLTISALLFPKQVKAQQDQVNFQIFYDELSPYGQWVDDMQYGYVWIPDAGEDFEPYSTEGHWILSEYGWTWVSNYDWGWAPFHYGRWDYDNYYGWFWVPDNEWGPAWVNWRSSNGYYGWSPMEPGLSVGLSFGRPYNRQNDHWNFVRDRDLERPDISRYYANQNDRNRIIMNSKVIRQTYNDNERHTTYITGPSRMDIQRSTGRIYNPVTIRERDRPGQAVMNGQLRIYRPQVNIHYSTENRPAPSRILDMEDFRRHSQRDVMNRPINSNQTERNNQGRPQNNTDRQNNYQRVVNPQTVIPSGNDNRVQPQQGPPSRQNNYNRPTAPQKVVPPVIDNSKQQPPVPVIPQPNNAKPVQPIQPQPAQPAGNNKKEQPKKGERPSNNKNDQKEVPKKVEEQNK